MVINPPVNLKWFRATSFLTITIWAAFGAASSIAVHDSSAFITPAPAWASSWTTTIISAPWLLAPILVCPALAAILGWRYLHGLGASGRRWRAAWFSISIVALAIWPLLIWSAKGYDFLQVGIDAPNPLWLLTGFLLAAAAMITMLTASDKK